MQPPRKFCDTPPQVYTVVVVVKMNTNNNQINYQCRPSKSH